MRKVANLDEHRYRESLKFCLFMTERAYDSLQVGACDQAAAQLKDILELFEEPGEASLTSPGENPCTDDILPFQTW